MTTTCLIGVAVLGTKDQVLAELVAGTGTTSGVLGAAFAPATVVPTATRDGTVIGAFSRSMAVAPLIAGAPFDATRLAWIGSISTDVSVCFTWHTSPIKTFDDMLATPFTMGGLGGGADPDIFALMLRNVFAGFLWTI